MKMQININKDIVMMWEFCYEPYLSKVDRQSVEGISTKG